MIRGASDDTFWRRYFKHYDTLLEVPAYQELLSRAATLCAVGPAAMVLDAGAGTGNLGPALARRTARIVALDLNDRGLAVARGKVPDAVFVRARLGDPLPLAEATFDAVVSLNVLYTLSEQARRACLAEARRVLKPEGRIVVAVPVRGASPLRIYAATLRRWIGELGVPSAVARAGRYFPAMMAILVYNARIKARGDSGDYTFFSRDAVADELARAGFAVEGVERAYADQNWLAWGRAR